jgi:hypothetical protein
LIKVNSAAQWRVKLPSAARVKARIALRGLSKFSNHTDTPYRQLIFSLALSNLSGSCGKWLFE